MNLKIHTEIQIYMYTHTKIPTILVFGKLQLRLKGKRYVRIYGYAITKSFKLTI